MRGTISAIAPDGSYGQVAAADGQRYSYWTVEVRNGRAEVGQAVEFEMHEGQPIDIQILPAPPPRPAAPPRSPLPQRGMRQGFPQQTLPQHNMARSRQPQAGAAYADIAAIAGGIPTGNYWVWLFTSANGRISRRQFWLHGVLPLIGAVIVLRIIAYILGMFLLAVMPTAFLFIDLIMFLLLLWPYYCISAKRFHDVGYPGWYNFFWIIPSVITQLLTALDLFLITFATMLYFVSLGLALVAFVVVIAALIFVFVRAGQQGANQYGPDPLAATY